MIRYHGGFESRSLDNRIVVESGKARKVFYAPGIDNSLDIDITYSCFILRPLLVPESQRPLATVKEAAHHREEIIWSKEPAQLNFKTDIR